MANLGAVDPNHSQVMEFIDNIKENRRALNEFMTTMHGTLTRNKISLN